MNQFENNLPMNLNNLQQAKDILQLPKEEVIQLFPKLLELIMEKDHPNSLQVAKLFLKYPIDSVPTLLEVLQENQENMLWKAWCLQSVVPKLPFYSKIALTDEIMRIAQNPTKQEVSKKIDKFAQEVLEGLD